MDSIVLELNDFRNIILKLDRTSSNSDLPDFSKYYAIQDEYLKEVSSEKENPGFLQVLKRRKERQFFEDCNHLADGRFFILLFDTFELVQESDVGRWFVKEFIPRMENFTVAFGGRPNSQYDSITKLNDFFPSNVLSFNLTGLDESEAISYYKSWGLYLSDSSVGKINTKVNGKPLYHYLIVKYLIATFGKNEYEDAIKNLSLKRIDEIEKITISWIFNELPLKIPEAAAAWTAMSKFSKRFDKSMLVHLIEKHKSTFFPIRNLQAKPVDVLINDILKTLSDYRFVKTREELESGEINFLLHDEMLKITKKHLPMAIDYPNFDKKISETIINEYYPLKIDEFKKRGNTTLANQYKVEQILYQIEKGMLTEYKPYLWEEINYAQKNDHAYEELLWYGIKNILDNGLLEGDFVRDIAQKRADWLYRTNQYEKALEQYKENLLLFPSKSQLYNINRVGHCHLRLGEYSKARSYYLEVQQIAKDEKEVLESFASMLAVAIIDQILGNWTKATKDLDELLESLHSVPEGNSNSGKYLIARCYYYLGYFVALDGKYDQGKNYCLKAIEILNKFEHPTNDLIYAYRFTGQVLRYSGSYTEAKEYLEDAIRFAENNKMLVFPIDALIDLGIVYHDEGKNERKDKKNPQKAISIQILALMKLQEGLTLVRQNGLVNLFGSSFGRMGRVVMELHRNLIDIQEDHLAFSKIKNDVMNRVAEIRLPEEDDWFIYKGLSSQRKFEDVDLPEKAIRLLELSYFEAEHVNDVQRAIQSLLDAALIAASLKQFDEVYYYLELMDEFVESNSDEHKSLYFHTRDIIQSILLIGNGNYSDAKLIWEKSFEALAKIGGFAFVLFSAALESVIENTTLLKIDTSIELLSYLKSVFINSNEIKSKPELIDPITMELRSLKQKKLILAGKE